MISPAAMPAFSSERAWSGGLYDEGRLWIDSCALVATSELDDELTPKPVVGAVAVPLVMPGPLPEVPVRCVDCAPDALKKWLAFRGMQMRELPLPQ